nr:hypothetical protein [Helicobacter pylori]
MSKGILVFLIPIVLVGLVLTAIIIGLVLTAIIIGLVLTAIIIGLVLTAIRATMMVFRGDTDGFFSRIWDNSLNISAIF